MKLELTWNSYYNKDKLKAKMEAELTPMTVFRHLQWIKWMKKLEKWNINWQRIKSCSVWKCAYHVKLETVKVLNKIITCDVIILYDIQSGWIINAKTITKKITM